jgi:hypothetical protein
MQSYDVWTFVIGLLGLIVIQGPMIWFSAKAKPLGDKPYRWGTYLAFTTALVAIVLALSIPSVVSNGNIFGAVLLSCLSAFAVITVIGLFRRRKFGVIAFILTDLLLFLFEPLMATHYNRPVSVQPAGTFLFAIIVLICTTIYFKKRWRFMVVPKPLRVASYPEGT